MFFLLSCGYIGFVAANDMISDTVDYSARTEDKLTLFPPEAECGERSDNARVWLQAQPMLTFAS